MRREGNRELGLIIQIGSKSDLVEICLANVVLLVRGWSAGSSSHRPHGSLLYYSKRVSAFRIYFQLQSPPLIIPTKQLQIELMHWDVCIARGVLLAFIIFLIFMEVNPRRDLVDYDFKLMKALAAPSESINWSRPKDLPALVALLKYKNKSDDPQHHVHLQRGREWLSKKGINIEPLLSRLDYAQKHPSNSQKSAMGSDNYFHVDLEVKNIPEYLQKVQEYGSMNLMQKIMSKGNCRKKFTLKFLEEQLSSGPNRFPVWQCQGHKQRRQVYIGLVRTVVQRKNQGKTLSQQLLRQFRGAMVQLNDDFLWQLLSLQLEAYKHSLPQHDNFTRMFVTSLKLINQEFQRRLHGQDFERYVSKHYVGRVEGRWALEQGGFWAKVWLYYCMGLEKDVIDLLSSSTRDYKDLAQLFIASEEALNEAKPMKEQYSSRYDVEDIFFEQFVFNITGQSRYSCEMMADPKSLELILIVVRTLGIFYQNDQEKFQAVRSGLLRSYRDYTSDPQVMRNIMYLLSYDEIVRMGPNSIMSSDDYLHFLLVLAGYPGVVNQSKLEPILTQQLVQFILQLMQQNQPEYIYYAALIPEGSFIGEVSSIILSANALDTFNWKGIEKLVKEELYLSLVYSTVQKYRLREKGDLKAARKIRELVQDQEKGFGYLLNLVVGHYLHRSKYPLEEVQQAEETGTAWAKEHGTSKVYRHLFLFVASLRLLLSLLVKRNEQLLKSFVSSCEFIVLDIDGSHSINLRMLELLSEHNGLDLYYYFLRLVVKGSEIYASRAREGAKLAPLKRMIAELVQSIQQVHELRVDHNSLQLLALKQQTDITNF